MNAFGLPGTARVGPSGTATTDYREPGLLPAPQEGSRFAPLNYANGKSSGFLLTQSPPGIKLSEPARERPQTPLQKPCPLDRRTSEPSAGHPSDRDGLTHVTLIWIKGRREDWLKFGKPVASRIVDRRRRTESYSAGQLFGLVCWAANEYGTVHSAFYIVRAVGPGEQVIPVPQVDPGGDLLLSVHGWPKVAQVFALIDAIEASGIDPCDVAPDHWQHIHNRLAARESPRGYSSERHRAWLARKALLK